MFKFLSIKVRIDLSCNLQFSSSQTPFSNLPETYMGMGCIGSLVHNLAGVQSRAVERVFDVLAFWRRRSIPIYSRDQVLSIEPLVESSIPIVLREAFYIKIKDLLTSINYYTICILQFSVSNQKIAPAVPIHKKVCFKALSRLSAECRLASAKCTLSPSCTVEIHVAIYTFALAECCGSRIKMHATTKRECTHSALASVGEHNA